MRLRHIVLTLLILATTLGSTAEAQRAGKITTPKESFGFNLGDDYQLANYTQLVKYWKTLESESPRLKLVNIGKTAEGRDHYTAVVTSAENHRKLDRYKDISRRLGLAEGLTDEQARALAREGKAVIFMDGGLHSTETMGHQALIELVYQLVSRNDEETLRILNDDILLLCLANPDGMELVSDWYMREPDVNKRTLDIPRLYQKYVGHDNARDLYMSNQVETQNINKLLFIDWIPQITHTHHQTGPAGSVVFMPPFRDPFNYGFEPLLITELDLIGAAMHSRLIAKGMPGSTMRSAANYSTWFNGAMRTVSYFHNSVGLLTETIGHPTPMEIPLVLERQLPSGSGPFPIAPQKWHMRQSINYDMEYSYAVMDVASRYREDFLFNIYRMGKNSIEKGSKDNWTITPDRIAAAQAAAAKMAPAPNAAAGRGATIVPTDIYATVLRDPAARDPRGYVIPADQPDFSTATKLVNVLLKNGIAVSRATAAFQVAGKQYPANSYVVKTAQAPRAFVLDMFEKQNHPDDFRYPGGPPVPPYDMTGWTPAFAMGVKFDRYQDGFDGPFVKIPGPISIPSGAVVASGNVAGYLVSRRANDAVTLANRLVKAKADVFWLQQPVSANGQDLGNGALYIPAASGVADIVRRGATELGLTVYGVDRAPGVTRLQVQPVRIGIVDTYGGNIPSGWTRWLFEQFEFPYEVVYPKALDAGNLRDKFDVLVFPDGSARFADVGRGRRGAEQPSPESLPAEYRGWLGTVTAERTLPELKKFADAGGTIVTVGSATTMAEQLGVPVKNHLVETTQTGQVRPLPQEKYYIPGSLLRMKISSTSPIAHGMGSEAVTMFDNSPVFRLDVDAQAKGATAVAWFAGKDVLASGWAWGVNNLEGGASVVDATVGKGRVLLFGTDVGFRGQTHGTYKLLFNGLLYGAARPVVTQ